VAAAIVSVHDVAPSTFEQSRAWVEMLDRHRIRASLLVVPLQLLVLILVASVLMKLVAVL
jgi:hypothetical protein